MSNVPPPSEPVQPAAPGAPAAKSPILSILSLIGGIAGVVLACCFGAGLLFGVAGAVLGHLALKKEPNGRGMAKTGLILGYVGAALSLIFIILSFAAPFLLAGIPGMGYTYSF